MTIRYASTLLVLLVRFIFFGDWFHRGLLVASARLPSDCCFWPFLRLFFTARWSRFSLLFFSIQVFLILLSLFIFWPVLWGALLSFWLYLLPFLTIVVSCTILWTCHFLWILPPPFVILFLSCFWTNRLELCSLLRWSYLSCNLCLIVHLPICHPRSTDTELTIILLTRKCDCGRLVLARCDFPEDCSRLVLKH